MDKKILEDILNEPETSEAEILKTIDQVFEVGANEIPPEEIFGKILDDVPTKI